MFDIANNWDIRFCHAVTTIYIPTTNPGQGYNHLARGCREGLLGPRVKGIPGEQAFDPGSLRRLGVCRLLGSVPDGSSAEQVLCRIPWLPCFATRA